jgi:hypothetical protein
MYFTYAVKTCLVTLSFNFSRIFFLLLLRIIFPLLLHLMDYINVTFHLNERVIIIFPTSFKFIKLETFSNVYACTSKIL